MQYLRDMFGYSGFIGVSKKIVFLEGADTSADRKTFSAIFGGAAREVKIIPAGSWGNLYRLNTAVLALLESDFARCSFFLIRDRDYLSTAAIQKYESAGRGRLFILKRYHIENYLINEDVISTLLNRVYQRQLSAEQVTAELRNIARQNSAAALRDLIVSRVSELYQSEDLSIGSHSSGQSIMESDGQLKITNLKPLLDALREKAATTAGSISNRTSEAAIDAIMGACTDEVKRALTPGSTGWKELFPGKYILQRFSSQLGLGDWPALQNLIIDEFAKNSQLIAPDLRDIINAVGANS